MKAGPYSLVHNQFLKQVNEKIDNLEKDNKKLYEFVKRISEEGWWSRKMKIEVYIELLDEHKRDSDECVNNLKLKYEL